MKVLLLGDIHGRFQLADRFYNAIIEEHGEENIDLLIQVGDFGFWPRLEVMQAWPRTFGHRAVFVDGNHEDHETLRRLQEPDWGMEEPPSKEWLQTMEAWEYMPRGTIENGILYIGGAHSIDYRFRMRGVDWFPEENISYEDQERVFDAIDAYGGPQKIHTVISHDCPASFNVLEACSITGRELVGGNRKFLEAVRSYVRPDYWFFGHYHHRMEGRVDNTWWRCIDMIQNSGYNDYVLIDLPSGPRKG